MKASPKPVEVERNDHSVFNLNYHVVLVTKYRNRVLEGKIEEYVKTKVSEICQQYDWGLLALEAMPDHIHVFVSAPPKIAPLMIGRTFKGMLTLGVFREFPNLKSQRFWGSGLFSRGTYYGSAGTVSAETIKKYIEEQKNV